MSISKLKMMMAQDRNASFTLTKDIVSLEEIAKRRCGIRPLSVEESSSAASVPEMRLVMIMNT